MNAAACLIGLATALPLKETFRKPLPEVDEDDMQPMGDDSYAISDDTAATSLESLDAGRDKAKF